MLGEKGYRLRLESKNQCSHQFFLKRFNIA